MATAIRPAKASDAEAAARLSGQLGYPAGAREMRRRIERLRRDALHGIFVAAEGRSVIAWMHVCRRASLESPDYAEIVGLVVDERHRGQGLGAELVRAAESWAEKRGLSRLRVRSNVIRERTHAFYRALGFETVKSQTVFDKGIGRGA